MLSLSLLGAYSGLELGSCTLNPLHPRLGLYQGLSLYRMTCTKHTEVSYSIVFLFHFSFLRISFFVHQYHMAQVTIGLTSYPNPGKSIEILLGFLLCVSTILRIVSHDPIIHPNHSSIPSQVIHVSLSLSINTILLGKSSQIIPQSILSVLLNAREPTPNTTSVQPPRATK